MEYTMKHITQFLNYFYLSTREDILNANDNAQVIKFYDCVFMTIFYFIYMLILY